MEPTTDKEMFIYMTGEFKDVRNSLSNLIKAIENMTTSFSDFKAKDVVELEKRLDVLEKSLNERSGGWKLVLQISVVLGIIAYILQLFFRVK